MRPSLSPSTVLDGGDTPSSYVTAAGARSSAQGEQLRETSSIRGNSPHSHFMGNSAVDDNVQRKRPTRRRHQVSRKHQKSKLDRNQDEDVETDNEGNGDGLGDQPQRLELSHPNAPSEMARRETNEAKPSSRRSPMTVSPKFDTTGVHDVPSSLGVQMRLGIEEANPFPDCIGSQPSQSPDAMLSTSPPMRPVIGGTTTLQGHIKEDDERQLSRTAAIILLILSTGLVAACAEFLISSIEDVTSTSTMRETFIGLILLPIVGNAAEHITAIKVAMNKKMDLAIGVAIRSSIQVALLITPVVVMLGWILDRPMSLYFTIFETVCLFVSTLIANFLVLDGRSNYLEGALLCAVYVIVGVVAFYYPEGSEANAWAAGEGMMGN